MTFSYLPTLADSYTFDVYPIKNERVRLPQLINSRSTSVPSVKPATYLAGFVSNGWSLIHPLQINIERDEDNSFVVSDDTFLVYGDGDTEFDAITDYVSSLIEFYKILENGANNNDFDKMQFSNLQAYLKSIG